MVYMSPPKKFQRGVLENLVFVSPRIFGLHLSGTRVLLGLSVLQSDLLISVMTQNITVSMIMKMTKTKKMKVRRKMKRRMIIRQLRRRLKREEKVSDNYISP